MINYYNAKDTLDPAIYDDSELSYYYVEDDFCSDPFSDDYVDSDESVNEKDLNMLWNELDQLFSPTLKANLVTKFYHTTTDKTATKIQQSHVKPFTRKRA